MFELDNIARRIGEIDFVGNISIKTCPLHFDQRWQNVVDMTFKLNFLMGLNKTLVCVEIINKEIYHQTQNLKITKCILLVHVLFEIASLY